MSQLGCRPAGLLHPLAVPHAALVATNHILHLTPRHWTHIGAAHPVHVAHERQHWCLHAYCNSGSNRCTQHTHAHADSHPRCSLTRTVGLTPAAPNYVTLPSSTAQRIAESVECCGALGGSGSPVGTQRATQTPRFRARPTVEAAASKNTCQRLTSVA